MPGGPYSSIAVRPHQRVRLTAVEQAPQGACPTNFAEEWGPYDEAYCQEGNIWYRRSNFATPPFAVHVQATDGGSDDEPCLTIDYRRRRRIVFTRAGGGALQALYHFESGTLRDDSSDFGRHLTGGAPVAVSGAVGGAMFADQAGDLTATVGSMAALQGTEITIAAWLRHSGGSATSTDEFMYWNPTLDRKAWQLYIDWFSEQLKLNIKLGATETTLNLISFARNTTWRRVVLTFKANDYSRIYVDGVLVDEQPSSPLIPNLNIAADPDNELRFTGGGISETYWDEVAVYDYAWTAAEVAEDAPAGGGENGVWEVWSDDDGETWSGPVSVIPGGKHPHVWEGHLGVRLTAAYVGGVLQAVREEPGGTLTTFTFQRWNGSSLVNLQVEDDTFAFCQGWSPASPWILVARFLGSGAINRYASHDAGETWIELT